MTRWRIPYTAPGLKSGDLTVTAPNRAAAVEKVTDILMRRIPAMLTDTTRPGARKSLALTTRERAQIQFGEPTQLEATRVGGESA